MLRLQNWQPTSHLMVYLPTVLISLSFLLWWCRQRDPFKFGSDMSGIAYYLSNQCCQLCFIGGWWCEPKVAGCNNSSRNKLSGLNWGYSFYSCRMSFFHISIIKLPLSPSYIMSLIPPFNTFLSHGKTSLVLFRFGVPVIILPWKLFTFSFYPVAWVVSSFCVFISLKIFNEFSLILFTTFALLFSLVKDATYG